MAHRQRDIEKKRIHFAETVFPANKMNLTFLISLLLIVFGVNAIERNPNMAVAISESGLQFFGKMITKIVGFGEYA